MNEKTDTLLVEVATDGRIVTFNSEDQPADTLPGLRFAFGDEPIEVPNTVGNRRRIRSGDLRVVDRKLPSTPETPAVAAFDASEVTLSPSTK